MHLAFVPKNVRLGAGVEKNPRHPCGTTGIWRYEAWGLETRVRPMSDVPVPVCQISVIPNDDIGEALGMTFVRPFGFPTNTAYFDEPQDLPLADSPDETDCARHTRHLRRQCGRPEPLCR